jgi:hypothetical protein
VDRALVFDVNENMQALSQADVGVVRPHRKRNADPRFDVVSCPSQCHRFALRYLRGPIVEADTCTWNFLLCCQLMITQEVSHLQGGTVNGSDGRGLFASSREII